MLSHPVGSSLHRVGDAFCLPSTPGGQSGRQRMDWGMNRPESGPRHAPVASFKDRRVLRYYSFCVIRQLAFMHQRIAPICEILNTARISPALLCHRAQRKKGSKGGFVQI